MGSSPLTRGKLQCTVCSADWPRLIPAHAGKTVSQSCMGGMAKAHPRSRGENLAWAVEGARAYGSSPLTRGKRQKWSVVRIARRLIPAHAGKTVSWLRAGSKCSAHPRSRGENRLVYWPTRTVMGSSPLTRGKLGCPLRTDQGQRLIPAHAGKTRSPARRRTAWPAHPRSRGENWYSCPAPPARSGSSPLTRGKLTLLDAALLPDRLIPAHAGKTLLVQPDSQCRPAHPRSRGENSIAHKPTRRPPGSSPLTRGKHFLTCAFTAQIDQILESLELAVSSGSYSIWVACATDAPQDPVRSIGLVLPSSRGAS